MNLERYRGRVGKKPETWKRPTTGKGTAERIYKDGQHWEIEEKYEHRQGKTEGHNGKLK
jgi:hypothetical protein